MLAEYDRPLGGGLVPGAVVLLGGAPGIGKSTLALWSLNLMAAHGPVLYASGEESLWQTRLRAERIGALSSSLLLLAAQDVDEVIEAALESAATVLVADSLQTMSTDGCPGELGSVSQVKAVTARLVSYAKEHDVPVVLIGHVTKDGAIAGPRTVEHLVDAVLMFEGEASEEPRVLRVSGKNRFGPTTEQGLFVMRPEGLLEAADDAQD